jgi:putative tryptophan/tyrosine transport system substrate-binding protein
MWQSSLPLELHRAQITDRRVPAFRIVEALDVVEYINSRLKRATSTIPIVFGMADDPVSDGLVESFNRPGGNATGVTTSTSLMEPKRLGLLRDLVPGVPLVGVLLNPSFPPSAQQLRGIEEAARTIGQRIVVAKASKDDGLDAAFMALVR